MHTCTSADPPEYTPSASPTTILEGAHFEYTFEFAANPPPDSFMWTRNNQTISDSRVTVSARDITIMDTVRDDSGVYRVTSSNAAGVGSASFTLNVQCEKLAVSLCGFSHFHSLVITISEPMTCPMSTASANVKVSV